MADGFFIDGAVRYPDGLPCPHADTDLTPRERRYISDIGEVKKLRRFQSTFQATRQNISFVFTPAQARTFREWYKNDIVEGGAWFYADWAILNKEKDVAYRFVTRPVWEFLARGNYHVSAAVELYGGRGLYGGRKVGKTANVYTSKLYPYYFSDTVTISQTSLKGMPLIRWDDVLTVTHLRIIAASETRFTFGDYQFGDDETLTPITIESASEDRYGYANVDVNDSVTVTPITIEQCEAVVIGLLSYDRIADDVTVSPITIVSGEKE